MFGAPRWMFVTRYLDVRKLKKGGLQAGLVWVSWVRSWEDAGIDGKLHMSYGYLIE